MSYQWVSTSANAPLPDRAVYAGYDCDGSLIYVGRCFYKGDQLVAKFIPSKQIAYVCHNGSEIEVYQIEVLTGRGFTWFAGANGRVPPRSVPSGKTVCGETLYVGRAHHKTSLTPGKVHPSHRCLYFPYAHYENKSERYEVLIFP